MSDVTIVPFSEATHDEVIKVVEAYYNNVVSLKEISEVWKVGDTSYNMIPPVKITHMDHDVLDTPKNGHTRALLSLRAVNMRIPIKSLPRMAHSYLQGNIK